MTYTQFRNLMKANAMNDRWFFSKGIDLIEQYPEWADRLVAEELEAAE